MQLRRARVSSERLRGLDIAQRIPVEELGLDPARAHDYSHSGTRHLRAVLRWIGVRPADAIVDLGCGKGGALLQMARFPFRSVTGVELSDELCRIARRNVERKRLRNVTIVHGDATEYDDYDALSHVYLYNPFPCQVVEAVLENLAASLRRRPRPLTLIYRNPECDAAVRSLFATVRDFPSPEAHPIRVYHAGHPSPF